MNLLITSQRCTLRPIEKSDNHSMFAYRGNKEVCRYQGWIPETLEDVNDFISRKQNLFGAVDTWFQLAIVFKESNKMIGDIGLHFLPNKTCEFGITLHPDHHDQGLAKEVLKSTMHYLSREIGIGSFKATIDRRNINSIHLFRSLGFLKIEDIPDDACIILGYTNS